MHELRKEKKDKKYKNQTKSNVNFKKLYYYVVKNPFQNLKWQKSPV